MINFLQMPAPLSGGGQFKWQKTLLLLSVIVSYPLHAETFVAGVSPELTSMITRCSPSVHPETMAALISTESQGHVFAIADAGPKHLPWSKRKFLVRSYYLKSLDSAVAKANELIVNGHTVSLGLTQVNDRNLAALGLSVREVFDTCTNLGAGGKIFTDFYLKAVKEFGPGPKALRAALSGYNSGNWVRGEKDGYVDLVFNQRGKPLRLKVGETSGRSSSMVSTMLARNKKEDIRAFTMSASEFTVGE